MENFDITIIETLQRTISINANTMQEAMEKTKEQYKQEKIVLDSSDFVAVDFVEG